MVRTVPAYITRDPSPNPEYTGLVDLEKVYCVDVNQMEAAEWAQLSAIYRDLPGGYRENQTPMWFGADESEPPFLWASVEPTGIQVCGVLSSEDWAEWDGAFLAGLAASTIPFSQTH